MDTSKKRKVREEEMDEEDVDVAKGRNETDKLSLRHAWDEQANRPVWAWDADRTHTFQCPDCHTSAILKRGTKRIAHFAHKAVEQEAKCLRYTHHHLPESELHKEVKLLLAEWIRLGRPLRFRRTCRRCSREISVRHEFRECKAVLEYRGDGFVADVAVVHTTTLVAILEVRVTHTTTHDRPEPW
jgi:hypothetical protein